MNSFQILDPTSWPNSRTVQWHSLRQWDKDLIVVSAVMCWQVLSPHWQDKKENTPQAHPQWTHIWVLWNIGGIKLDTFRGYVWTKNALQPLPLRATPSPKLRGHSALPQRCYTSASVKTLGHQGQYQDSGLKTQTHGMGTQQVMVGPWGVPCGGGKAVAVPS